MKPIRWWLLMAALAGSACAAQDRPAASEPRARQAGSGLAAARQRLQADLAGDASRLADIERRLAEETTRGRMHCGADEYISFLKSPRAHSRRQDCLRQLREFLAGWLDMQRVRVHLAHSPLRPVPAPPPSSIATALSITKIVVAEQAGVALTQSGGPPWHTVALDIDSGRELWRSPLRSMAEQPQALSPNGRVFATYHVQQNALLIRATETGEDLASLPQVTALSWLGQDAALVRIRRSEWRLLDLANGKFREVQGIDPAHRIVLAVPGHARRFVGLGESLQAMTLEADEAGQNLRVTLQANAPARVHWQLPPAGTAGERHVEAAGGQLHLVTLAALSSRTLPIPGAGDLRVVPTPKPDELLVSMRTSAGMPWRTHLLSLSKQTLSPVQSTGDTTTEPHYLWIAALQRVGIMREGRVDVLADLRLGQAVPLHQVASQLADENRRQHQLAQQEHTGQPSAFVLLPVLPTDAAALARLGRDVRIEGIGIERAEPAATAAGSSADMEISSMVRVHVQSSNRPVIVVLAAREAVRWSLSTSAGVDVAAVLLTGHPRSSVEAASTRIPVYRLGEHAPWNGDGPEFMALQQEIKQLAGRPLQSFQHRRGGKAFVLGG